MSFCESRVRLGVSKVYASTSRLVLASAHTSRSVAAQLIGSSTNVHAPFPPAADSQACCEEVQSVQLPAALQESKSAVLFVELISASEQFSSSTDSHASKIVGRNGVYVQTPGPAPAISQRSLSFGSLTRGSPRSMAAHAGAANAMQLSVLSGSLAFAGVYSQFKAEPGSPIPAEVHELLHGT